MSTECEHFKELSELPEESRTSLASALSERQDEADDEEACLWLEEIGRRDAEIRAGNATLKPVDQVMREVRAIFGWKTFRGRER